MLVIDIEASGLDPHINSLLSIGAVDFENPENQFYGECKMWEGAIASEEALEVNGFTQKEITQPDKKPLEILMYEFEEWIKETNNDNIVLAGQNSSFDRDFLNSSFHRANIDFKFAIRNLDLHSVAYYDHIKRNIPIPLKNGHTTLSLDNIVKYSGLKEEPKPHNALNGAKFEAEAFSRIIYSKKLLPEFIEYEIPKYLI